jgi:hypothetical protein
MAKARNCPHCGQFMKYLPWVDRPRYADDWYWECKLCGPFTIYSHAWKAMRPRRLTGALRGLPVSNRPHPN